MWTFIGIVALVGYVLLWFKKWKIAATATLSIILVGTLGFSIHYYWNGFQENRVEISVNYDSRDFKTKDTGIVKNTSSMERKPLDEIFSDSGSSQLTREEKIELLRLLAKRKLFPLKVIVQNNSSRKVMKANFSIGIFAKGRSTDLSKYESYTSDKILNPGEADTSRWRIPSEEELQNPGNYDYQIKYKNVEFE